MSLDLCRPRAPWFSSEDEAAEPQRAAFGVSLVNLTKKRKNSSNKHRKEVA